MPKTAHYSPFTTSRPGARLYHSTASVWLSVDPLSDKYPSASPYVYCAGNPVQLVDPDGREIGDYFDYKGVFLGTDGIDDGKVYIVSSEHWDEIKNSGFVDDYGMNTISSAFINAEGFSDWFQKPSEADLSDDAVFNIVKHYNTTGTNAIPVYGKLPIDEQYAMQTNFSSKEVSHLQIYIPKWFDNSIVLDNYYNIKSTYDHESGHIDQYKKLGYNKFASQSIYEREKYAVDFQKGCSSYQRVSSFYQKGIDLYLESQK